MSDETEQELKCRACGKKIQIVATDMSCNWWYANCFTDYCGTGPARDNKEDALSAYKEYVGL